MALFLDSADPEEARDAMSLGFVEGITTNPTLIARTGLSPEEVIPQLCDLCPGTVFYQLMAPTISEREAEAERILALRPRQIGLKIPASLENLALVSRFVGEVPVAVTAIFSVAQGYLATLAGADYVLPYVNRVTRLYGDGFAFVRKLAELIEAVGEETEILAASIKSGTEAVETILAGAHHVSLPMSVIREMGHHPLSAQAIADFSHFSPGVTRSQTSR
jgi:transaldolase